MPGIHSLYKSEYDSSIQLIETHINYINEIVTHLYKLFIILITIVLTIIFASVAKLINYYFIYLSVNEIFKDSGYLFISIIIIDTILDMLYKAVLKVCNCKKGQSKTR